MTKAIPPQELSPQIVPRSAPHMSLEDSRRSDIQSRVIRWRDLVLAVWALRQDEQYTGTLPEGLSAQQFWAKVTRQARALGGEVGVATRGRRWWAWSVKRGQVKLRESKATRKRAGVDGLWAGVVAGKRQEIAGEMSMTERRSLKRRAWARGIRLGIVFDAEENRTVVWKIEGDDNGKSTI